MIKNEYNGGGILRVRIRLSNSVASWWVHTFQRLLDVGYISTEFDVNAMLICNVGTFCYWGDRNIYGSENSGYFAVADILPYIVNFQYEHNFTESDYLWLTVDDANMCNVTTYASKIACYESHSKMIDIIEKIIPVDFTANAKDMSAITVYEHILDFANKISNELGVTAYTIVNPDDCDAENYQLLFANTVEGA